MSDTRQRRPDKPESVRVSAAKCPICGNPTQARYRPFCSRRCADVDLSKWLTEDYRVPTDEPLDPMAIPPDENRGDED